MKQTTNPQHDETQDEIDKRWAEEGESRLDAYLEGKLESIPISRVFEELEKECGGVVQ